MSYQIRSSSGILELSSVSFVLLLTCFSSSAVHKHIFINSLNCTLYHLSHNFQFSSSSDASVDLHLFYPPTRRLFHPPTPANLKSLHIQIVYRHFAIFSTYKSQLHNLYYQSRSRFYKNYIQIVPSSTYKSQLHNLYYQSRSRFYQIYIYKLYPSSRWI